MDAVTPAVANSYRCRPTRLRDGDPGPCVPGCLLEHRTRVVHPVPYTVTVVWANRWTPSQHHAHGVAIADGRQDEQY